MFCFSSFARAYMWNILLVSAGCVSESPNILQSIQLLLAARCDNDKTLIENDQSHMFAAFQLNKKGINRTNG